MGEEFGKGRPELKSGQQASAPEANEQNPIAARIAIDGGGGGR
jgi:hypothetical protein